MTTDISSWRRDRRFRAMVGELKALSPGDLSTLGIARSQIDHIALELSLVEHSQAHRPIIALVAILGLIGLWGFR